MFAVVHIPNFALQAVLRHDPALTRAPVALLTEDKTPVVWQMTAAAAEAGVETGQASPQALARCANLVFKQRQIAQEENAQQALLQCAYGFAAFLESTAPGVCTMDLRGLPDPGHSGGWQTRGRLLLDRLSQFHLEARLGIAATPGLAWQAAQNADPILWVENVEQFRRRLRVQSLPASNSIQNILQRWGLQTTDQFLALGKDRVSERLGREGVELFEAASAEQMRPLRLTVPEQSYEEHFEFEQEIETLEPLLFLLRRFLEQLTRRVSATGQVVQELELTLQLSSEKNFRHVYRIPAPTAEVEVLFRILHNHLETIRTDAAIRAIRLRAAPCAPVQQQFELFESPVRDPNRFFETIGCLSALIGEGRVGTPVVRDTHRPDDFVVEPVSMDRSASRPPLRRVSRGLALRRLRPPISITVRLRNQHPEHLQSPRASGPVLEAKGPWRSSGDWWEAAWSREEWDVATRDGLYRVFRQGEEWFLEGVYD